MAQTLIKTIADFNTTLVTKTAVGATTATLVSGLDDDGVQLPTGTYGFTIDRNNSAKEHFTATLTGAALTNIATVTRGTGAGTSGLLRIHRKGAEVIISDHVAIKRMMNVLDGTTNLDSGTPLGYDGAPTISTGNQLATKTYVDSTSKTMTNTRITKRVVGTTSSAAPTPNADTTDIYTLTALAENATFGEPSGTPTNGQLLVIRIKPDGTIRSLSWNAVYVAGGVALPTATVASKILTVLFMYNTDNSLNKWMCLASAQEA